MIRKLDCYDVEDWRKLLDDDTNDSKSLELTAHLETCVSCRMKLEQTAADHAWWIESTSTLAEASSTDATLHDFTSFERRDHAHHIVLRYLKPSDDEHSLGSIGSYQVQRVLGSGGMGLVVQAFDPSLHRTVAIKLLHPHLAAVGAARQRFAREAKASAAVVHSNVVPIHAVITDNELPYLVMSYIPGETLQERIDREGALPVNDALRIASQIADGLAAAHQHGLVHRDIKPANILMETGTARVWLTDFGLARALDDATLTASGFIAGTPQYMSPEQANGESVDHRSDLFSLGSVLYAMLAGRPPFRAESSIAVLRRIVDHEPRSLLEVRPEVPIWVQAFVAKLQSKQTDERFQSAANVSELLRQAAVHFENPQQMPLPKMLEDLSKREEAKTTDEASFFRSGFSSKSIRVSVMALVGCIILYLVYLNWQVSQITESFGSTGTASVDIADRPTSESFPTARVNMAGSDRSIPPSSIPAIYAWDSIDQDLQDIHVRLEQLQLPFFPGIKETQEND